MDCEAMLDGERADIYANANIVMKLLADWACPE